MPGEFAAPEAMYWYNFGPLGIFQATWNSVRSNRLLFEVSAADPLVYVGVSALLAAVALTAVAVPSCRATRIDPLLALRDS